MANYTKTWRVPTWRGVAVVSSGSDIAANRLTMLDTATGSIGGLPAAILPSGTPKVFVGVAPVVLVKGRIGNVACTPGDVVVLISDGAINIGERLTISTAGGKEGYAKTDATGDVIKVGYALEATSGDGEYFLAVLDPKMAEA